MEFEKPAGIPAGSSAGSSTGSAAAPPPPPLEYTPPGDAAAPRGMFSLEVIKNGAVVETIPLRIDATFATIGRLPICDVPMEHQTVSRYHAVIQFHADGSTTGTVTLYDLGSRHGTKLNKQEVPARTHVRWRVGSMVRLGESSRLLVLNGEEADAEEPDDAAERRRAAMRVAAMTSARRQRKEEEDAAAAAARAHDVERDGITWGLVEDAVDEDDPAAVSAANAAGGAIGDRHPDRDENGELWFMSDPKKILRTWFEQQGQRLEFEVQEDGPGHARIYTAQLKLPLEGPFGQPGRSCRTAGTLPGVRWLTRVARGPPRRVDGAAARVYNPVMATGTGSRKKDAETDCAVDACTKLDGKGLLRTDVGASAAVAAERKRRMKELFGETGDNDDDDEFFDRAGTPRLVERRQQKELQKAPSKQQVSTFESLSARRLQAHSEQLRLKQELVEFDRKQAAAAAAAKAQSETTDELDAYLDTMKQDVEGLGRRKVLMRIVELQKELAQLDKLIELVRPHGAVFQPPAAAPATTVAVPPSLLPSAQLAPPRQGAPEPVLPTNPPTEPPSLGSDPKPAAAPSPAATRPPRSALPPPADTEASRASLDDVDEPSAPPAAAPPSAKKARRVYGAMTHDAYAEAAAKDVSDWVPPSNQSGDGRTKLNDKLGY